MNERIKKVRKILKLTQEQFGKKSGSQVQLAAPWKAEKQPLKSDN